MTGVNLRQHLVKVLFGVEEVLIHELIDCSNQQIVDRFHVAVLHHLVCLNHSHEKGHPPVNIVHLSEGVV